jgi:murein DD-endopeptidase MepM/ murein hydrolase activator NlpD
MTTVLARFCERIFQPKQILIRRAGQVSSWNVSRAVQWLLLFIAMIFTYWLYSATTGFLNKSEAVEHITSQGQLESQQWQVEKRKLESQLAQQKQQLLVLQQKQVLLQEVVDSLPSSLTSTNTNQTVAEQATPLDEVHSSLEHTSLSNDDLQSLPDIHHSEASHAESSEHEQLVTPAETNTTANDVSNTLLILEDEFQTLRDVLASHIATRHASIKTSLSELGMLNNNKGNAAQGGPLHQLDDDTLPPDYLELADSLVRLNELEQVIAQLPSALPAEDYYVSSRYGLRKDPITGQRAFHKGVDLAGWHKTKIFAPADGVVVRAGRNGGYGNFIELEHANGVKTRFGHLHKINVKKGQQVNKQDVIALMGSTGRSTSTHLHYEVLHNNKHINPIKLTKALSSVQ